MAKSLAVWISKSNENNEEKPHEVDDTEVPNREVSDDSKLNDEALPKNNIRGIELHFNYWVLNDKNLNRRTYPLKDNTWRGPFKLASWAIHHMQNGCRWLISFAKERENTTYLDVGVRFSLLTEDDTINIFFPFSVSPQDYDSQLGLNLANDNQLLSAIFNSELESIEFKDNLYHHSDINFSSKGDDLKTGIRFFTNIDLQDNNSNPLGAGVSLHSVVNEGSILSFPIKNFRMESSDKDGYFRFRLILNPLSKKALSTYYIPSDSFMLTTEESIEIIDFRVNEIRNTPKNVNSLLKSGDVLKKVHFFLIREVKSEYVMSDTKYHRSRLLEGDLWQAYLQSQYVKPIKNVPKMLIFHWKSSKEDLINNKYLENFSAFAKFRHARHSAWIILRSIAIVLIFSMIANGLYDFIKNNLTK
ncbi:hypothetical protein BIY29_17745 [Brenneria alni]|uniref:Uncharacterized protein n=1 Tax=Brenneria alni TaxID=71656 RepID=A0A421DJI3_9GAMM|nr:hypothetical protein [Brenneria alni]RLM18753.1 hypothetical protein BIY29_17745 [Brenneria alni]